MLKHSTTRLSLIAFLSLAVVNISILRAQVGASPDASSFNIQDFRNTLDRIAKTCESTSKIDYKPFVDIINDDTQKISDLQRNINELEKKKKDLENDIGNFGERLSKDYDTRKKALESEIKSLEDRQRTIDNVLKRYTSEGFTAITEVIEVRVDGQEIMHSLGDGKVGQLRDAPDQCLIQIRLRENAQKKIGFKTLAGANIVNIRLLNTAKKNLELPPISYKEAAVTLNRVSICAPNRKHLENHENLELIIDYIGKDDTGQSRETQSVTYTLEYSRSTVQFDFAVGTFFAGGKTTTESQNSGQFAIFPALKLGLRLNLSLNNDNNRDFYLQFNALLGGGFAIPSPQPEILLAPSPMLKEQKNLTLFAGISIELSKYIEIGYAYDWFNSSHLCVLAPGRLLSASIFRK